MRNAYEDFEDQVDTTIYRLFNNSLKSNLDKGIEGVVSPSNLEYFGFCGIFIEIKMDSSSRKVGEDSLAYEILSEITSEVGVSGCIIPDFKNSILLTEYNIQEINGVNCLYCKSGKFLKSETYYENARYMHHGCSIGYFENSLTGNLIHFLLIW
jgi:hypothetical protein